MQRSDRKANPSQQPVVSARRDDAQDAQIAALQATVSALPQMESGVAAFDGSGKAIDIDCDLIGVGTYSVLVSHNTPGTAIGNIYSDRAEDSAPTFSVRSDNPLDDSEFTWLVLSFP